MQESARIFKYMFGYSWICYARICNNVRHLNLRVRLRGQWHNSFCATFPTIGNRYDQTAEHVCALWGEKRGKHYHQVTYKSRSEARRTFQRRSISINTFANHHINVLFIPSTPNHLDLHTVCECFIRPSIIFSPQLQPAQFVFCLISLQARTGCLRLVLF